MSNIDKHALREAAEKALPAMQRLLMMPNDELFDEVLLNVDGDVDAANAFNLLAGPENVLALLDELEAAEKRIAEHDRKCDEQYLLGMRAGWNFGTLEDADGFDAAYASRSKLIEAERAATAGKGEAS
ncbi:ead/Ea22-like family protein [Enterobacter hormaechei]|uniref:ead/Ea22-like family protein n=1 Tax=Enterobacter hormaechei TaxID=158836 RepID=UPI001BE0020F|nr:ead/Ea22-like family protein [Enterobacter hormaechei]MBT1896947.1 ead/Ea22-like family protein [Enterobacter hormaechei subsp. xiangfangensis]MBW7781494.1 ead/Ea22-like family protein [Enterobacter hormaechei]